MDLKELLKLSIQQKASDLHLTDNKQGIAIFDTTTIVELRPKTRKIEVAKNAWL